MRARNGIAAYPSTAPVYGITEFMRKSRLGCRSTAAAFVVSIARQKTVLADKEKGDHLVKYILLIYSVEADWQPNHPDAEALMGEYMAFGKLLEDTGRFIAGDGLQPVASATTVRVRDGAVQTTDGPFAETKEQLGGYYVVEANDLDEAIDLATRIPDVRNGCVEIRPVMEYEQPEG